MWYTSKIESLNIVLLIGFLLFGSAFQNGGEICDNGIDDDKDGSIDLGDDECVCSTYLLRSMIPNHSFEDMLCCPDAQDQFDCVRNWIKASGPTTDYVNLCGYTGNPEIPPPYPFPDGEGVAGFRDGVEFEGNVEVNWKEYAGVCLTEPLIQDEDYVFIFNLGFINPDVSPPFDFTLYGHASCDGFPFGDIDIGCPLNAQDWFEIASLYVDGGSGNTWIRDTMFFRAMMNFDALAIGPSCTPTIASGNTYYYMDELILDNELAFDLQIKTTGDLCDPNFSLIIGNNAANNYQWYRDNAALVGETSHSINTHGVHGTYVVRVTNDKGCFLSQYYVYRIPEIVEFIDLTICEGDSYVFGDRTLSNQGTYVHTFDRDDLCDSVVSLNLFVQEVVESENTVRILQNEEFEADGHKFRDEGKYTYTIPSSIGCDSIVHLNVEFINFYFPNIFSPNGDGINDVFEISGESGELEFVEIYIIDRWGNLVSKGKSWDGTNGDYEVSHGVYLYIAKIRLVSGLETEITGNIMVVK